MITAYEIVDEQQLADKQAENQLESIKLQNDLELGRQENALKAEELRLKYMTALQAQIPNGTEVSSA